MKAVILYLSALLCTILSSAQLLAQPAGYTVSNAHSHNDYEQKIPFWLAYQEGFGSIEADIFLHNGELLVAHEARELVNHRTLEDLYLHPLQSCVDKNSGHPYADASRRLQILIDIKTDSIETLDKLIETLRKYPALISNPSLQFVITGNRPDASLFAGYPSFISFDGVLSRTYSKEALDRIAMLSDNFQTYSRWNGKGRVPEKEWAVLQDAVKKGHQLKKAVRFWGAPDFINAWYQFMHLQVDFINTDHIVALSTFLQNQPRTAYTSGGKSYEPYRPTYKTDGVDRPVRNVILLIGDGTGLAQLYAGYTANKGALNIFSMRNIGLSKTSSYDNYVTDSAPGSTAFSSGKKTNNRYVGVDHTGAPLTLLPAILAKRNIRTGLVTCGDISDATPADFYAHQSEREHTNAILKDLKNAPIDILMGSGQESLDNAAILKGAEHIPMDPAVFRDLSSEYMIVPSVDSVIVPSADAGAPSGTSENSSRTAAAPSRTTATSHTTATSSHVATTSSDRKWIVVEKRAGLSMLKGRGDWLSRAFDKSIDILQRNKAGFFLMTEGAQVDYGGHSNSIPYVAAEVLDFDQVVGKALEFADRDGQTLVIVTADHETGGLSLLDGDYPAGYVGGQFSTNDHTAIPVPVFAYGPRSGLFRGVYENTEIFFRILEAYGVSAGR